MREWNLHTVCEEAHCPNIGECWEDAHRDLHDPGRRLHAELRLLRGDPRPARVGGPRGARARSVARWRELGLEHVVITSVNRDDLADGGAAHWAATIRAVRREAPRCRVEVLIPDFQGRVVARRPSSRRARTSSTTTRRRCRASTRWRATAAATSGRSSCSATLARSRPALVTKSGIILGLGEERDELIATMRDLREVGVAILTLGQYLRPSAQHLPVARYYHPDEFVELAADRPRARLRSRRVRTARAQLVSREAPGRGLIGRRGEVVTWTTRRS